MTRAAAIAAATAALLVGASSALADPPPGHNPQGDKLGVIAPKGSPNKTGGSKLLVNHGGTVMGTNNTFAIYWGPSSSWPAGYTAAISKFFTDVQADNGKSTNVYAVDTQYSGIQYQSTFGSPSFAGAVNDTQPYPSNGCNERGLKVCLSDGQLQTEITRLINAGQLPAASPTTAYFVLTPPNVGSCGSGVGCAFKNFCAYHSWFPASNPTTIYADIPFADQSAGCNNAPASPAGTPGQTPVGSSADATLDGLSHEHNEMITDPFGTGWFTTGGFEIGDLCNFTYGTPLGGDLSAGSAYNQLINGQKYFIQEEWSNAGAACAQSYTP